MCQLTRNLLAAVLLLVSAVTHPAYCIADPELTFAGIANIPPMAFEENGAVKGLFPDLFCEIAKRAGFQTTIRLLPFKRLLAYVRDGIVDGTISIYHNKEREAYLIYSQAPVLISNTRVYVNKDEAFEFNTIEDLFGKRIGIISGWALKNSELEQAIQEGKIYTEETTHYEFNLKKLKTKRIDCFIAGEQLTWYHANRLGIADDVVALKKRISKSVTFIAVSKQTKNIADPQGFMEKIDIALDTIMADGTYDRIQKKYGVVSIP